jgi:porin
MSLKWHLSKTLLTMTVLALTYTSGNAQESAKSHDLPEAPPAQARSIEDLNMQGGDAAMPPLADSVIDVHSEFRRALLSKGVALRVINLGVYAQNTLRAPVPADQQSYVGEHPYGTLMTNPILTWDLRQLGLHHAQLNLSGVGQWVSWEPAGPKALDLWTLYLYKEFGKDRVEIKAGYNTNDLEFTGMQVGGSTASGVQGVYAVLPYEVGMAFFPLPAPQFNLKLNGPAHTYLKSGLQRGLDPEGGPATEARNHSGLRFAPKGDKLLLLEEAGYRRSSSETASELWLRAGYLRNSTLYTDLANGKKEPGNHGAYALVDYQLRKPDPKRSYKGLYIGGSVMTAASKFNPFDRYYEARIYQMAPFRKRPGDVASILSTYTGHSKYLTDSLIAQGKTVWRNSPSLTGSYNIHLAPGNYLSLGLSYIRGAAITPRVDDTLTFAATYSVFF